MSNFSPEQRIERAFYRAAYVLRSIWEEDGRYDTRLLDEPLIPSGYVTVGESIKGAECKEHVVPRDAICRECVKMFEAKSDLSQVATFIRNNLKIVFITREERYNLDSGSRLNMRKRMPDNWRFEGGDVFARLRHGGIEFRLFSPDKRLHARCEDTRA